jgi:hypothetical protein
MSYPAEVISTARLKEIKQTKRLGVYNTLTKHGIAYEDSKIRGVVVINGTIHLSTQPRAGKYRFRLAGSRQWSETTAPAFVANLKAGRYNVTPKAAAPVAEVVVEAASVAEAVAVAAETPVAPKRGRSRKLVVEATEQVIGVLTPEGLSEVAPKPNKSAKAPALNASAMLVKSILDLSAPASVVRPNTRRNPGEATLHFGQYAGKTIQHVYENDNQYFYWLLRRANMCMATREKVTNFIQYKLADA